VLPVLFAGGLGAGLAWFSAVFGSDRSLAERWANIASTGFMLGWMAAAGVGLLALWVAVLTDTTAAASQTPGRRWLAAGLAIGLLAAGRLLWTMAAGGHSYGLRTWLVWLGLLLGPIVLASYYLVLLLHRNGGAA
jgi:hypothetical protein